mgnify:CR=1 FL=1
MREFTFVNDRASVPFQISENKLSVSQIEFTNTNASPPVIEIVQPVGYGDDRFHSDTVAMLRKLTKTYGIINSFTGATFADKITLDLSTV